MEGTHVKVIALCQGIKEGKSIGSLLSGDTFDLENEVILLANQRSFNYAVVKVGNIINDSSTDATLITDIPESSIVKRMKEAYFTLPSSVDQSINKPSIKVMETVKNKVFARPMMVTLSRLDQTESTCVSVACEIMLRAATFPLLNSTSFGVISTPTVSTVISSTSTQSPPQKQQGVRQLTVDDYNDELNKLVGPELYRIPLKYASMQQVLVRLNRLINKLQEPGSGLITPIAVEKYANAVRIIFKPKESSYMSMKEENLITMENIPAEATSPVAGKAKPTGYMSPEMEAKLEKEEAAAALKAKQQATTGMNTPSPLTSSSSLNYNSSNELLNKQKKAALKLEGGLEILVDELPYKRLRIRRCNMGRNTIVKEESEGMIVKTILNSIQVLENDYRIMLDTDLASLSKLN